MKLILASQSPRRKELLASLGVEFTTSPAHVDESHLKHETPLAYVQRIALAKAQKVAEANPGCVVLAADTPVIAGRRILQNPQTEEEAADMLRLQSGRRVDIPTAVVAISATGSVHRKLCRSWVKYARLSEAVIQAYVAHPQNWKGISGALQIEEPAGQTLISTMHGSYSGILGLPLYETMLLLKQTKVL